MQPIQGDSALARTARRAQELLATAVHALQPRIQNLTFFGHPPAEWIPAGGRPGP